MPRRERPKLSPVDPTPGALSLDQLLAEGTCKKAEALQFLGIGERRLTDLCRARVFPWWKDGRDRVFPRVGLRAFRAAQAREQGVVVGS